VASDPREIGNWLGQMMLPYGGNLEYGWLAQKEKSAGRTIYQSMFARWTAGK
jgi:hypothetical protein